MRIMLGYHDLALDSKIIETTIEHAKIFDAQLLLVTSLKIGEDIPKSAFDAAEEYLKKGKAFFLDQGIKCTTHLIETNLEPGEDLVRFALKNRVDELIIGVKNRSKLGKLIFGSTAQYIILKSSCPVLSIRDEI